MSFLCSLTVTAGKCQECVQRQAWKKVHLEVLGVIALRWLLRSRVRSERQQIVQLQSGGPPFQSAPSMHTKAHSMVLRTPRNGKQISISDKGEESFAHGT